MPARTCDIAQVSHVPAPRTAITRIPEKGSTDRAELDRLLDAMPVGHVGLVDDGHPVVIPTFVARDGDRLLVHGSTGSRWMRALAAGAPASVAVTAWDGILLARSVFESSLHYRSAVLFGTFTVIEGQDKPAALEVMVESIAPGRTGEVRASTAQELAATLILALPIERWSLKISAGPPGDPPGDVAGPAWAGLLPLTLQVGAPVAAPDLRAGIALAPSAQRLASAQFTGRGPK